MTTIKKYESRRVIRFYVSLSFDVYGGTCVWVYAPANWDDMTESERDQFIEREFQQWADEKIEVGAVLYESVDAARTDTCDENSNATRWHGEIETWYD